MIARATRALSDAAAAVDRFLLAVCVAAIAALVLGNVAVRLAGSSVAWADELAVYLMAFCGFLGASLMLRLRMDPAVTLLQDALPAGAARALKVVVALGATAFGLLILWLCWRWFDLPGLAAAGWRVAAFQGATFNFIYTDVTPVMGLPRIVFYAIMPWFGLTYTLHGLNNLAEEVGLLDHGADHHADAVGEG
jgi:TRAP-type C4-dicarboxylate transport system permease small subunit